jgi:hypothetical protein
MIIKNQQLKVNKVITISWQCLDPDCVTKVPHHHQDVYISGLDADLDPFVITLHDPSFALPKEGETWTLSDADVDFELLQET